MEINMKKAIVSINVLYLLLFNVISHANRELINPAIDKYPAISVTQVTHLLNAFGVDTSSVNTDYIDNLKSRVIYDFQFNGFVENYTDYIHALHNLAVKDSYEYPAKCDSQFHRSMHFALHLAKALEEYSTEEGNNPVDERLSEVISFALHHSDEIIDEPTLIIGAVKIIENLVFEGMTWDEFYYINIRIGRYVNNITQLMNSK